MDCVVLAGGRPIPGEALFEITRGDLKATIEIGGRPMIAWVVDALRKAASIDGIAVVGLGAGEISDLPVDFVPDHGTMIDNVMAGIHWSLDRGLATETLMLCSADIPALTGSAVDQFILDCAPFDRDAYYPVVTMETMISRFPASNRTYSRFKDVTVAGGDLIVIRHRQIQLDRRFWQDIFDARKYPWRIAKRVGLQTLLRYAAGRMTLADAEETGAKILGHPVKVILARHPEIAMDVDDLSHLEMLADDLGRGDKPPSISKSQ